MGDSKICKQKGRDRINKIVSLFEITRPNKPAKALQRTNSLPLKKPSEKEDTNSLQRSNWTRTSTGKVQRIKKKIEEKSQDATADTHTEHNHHRKYNHLSRLETLHNKWDHDHQKNIYNLSRIQDVSEEVEEGNTELEISYEAVSVDNDDCVSIDTEFSRLSSETLQNRSDSQEEGSEVNFTSYCEFVQQNEGRNWELSELIDKNESYALLNEPEANNNRQDELTLSETIPDDEQHFKNDLQPKIIEFWKLKSFVQVNDKQTDENSDEFPTTARTTERRFIKNKNRSSLSKRERRRTGFKDAAEKGETESYRKSVINELDVELEKMAKDGFDEELYLSFNGDYEEKNEEVMEEMLWNEKFGSLLRKSIANLKLLDDDKQEATTEDQSQVLFPTNMYVPSYQAEEAPYMQEDDPFGETYFGDGLETGFVYLEAYNQDDKELVECSVQVDRRSVDLQRFNEIQAGSNLVTANKEGLVIWDDDEGESKRSTIYSTTSAESYEVDPKGASEDSGTDSKRNTIYSTTSGESYDDEDSLEVETEASNYNAARRETFCDDQGRVRIERVTPYEENVTKDSNYVETINHYYEAGDETLPQAEEEHDYESIRLEHDFLTSAVMKKEKIQYILDEIVSTERKYISDMGKVLKDYTNFIKRRYPHKLEAVFGNMPVILNSQSHFLKALEEADSNVDEIINAFISFKELFALYPIYVKNTPNANMALKELAVPLKERQERIQDKLDLSAYLLTPLQRLAKYKLFLENIIKQLEKDGYPSDVAKKALNMIKKFLSKGNDAVAIASIINSPLHPLDYGSFILREKFSMVKPKKLDVVVFLFQKIIIFTHDDIRNMEQFLYMTSIRTNDLRIATFEDNQLIHLTDYTKTKKKNSSKFTFVLDARNSKTKDTWKLQIEEILWKQMIKLKADSLSRNETLTPPVVRRKPTKNIRERNKSTGSSVFYVE